MERCGGLYKQPQPEKDSHSASRKREKEREKKRTGIRVDINKARSGSIRDRTTTLEERKKKRAGWVDRQLHYGL